MNCKCGCGGVTTVYRGVPRPFINGHNRRFPLVRRFWEHVNKKGSVPIHCPELGVCWEWTGAKNNRGYGVLQTGIKDVDRRTVLAHRIAWLLATGKSSSLQVLHRCDNRACVRKSHLFEGTQSDNIQDMMQKGRHA